MLLLLLGCVERALEMNQTQNIKQSPTKGKHENDNTKESHYEIRLGI